MMCHYTRKYAITPMSKGRANENPHVARIEIVGDAQCAAKLLIIRSMEAL